MFGWILATVGIVALIATLKRHHRRRHGYAYHRLRRGWRRRGLLRGLFWQLETTPGQENAIVAALDEAFVRMRHFEGELPKARRELGALLGSDTLDRGALEALVARQKAQLDAASAELVRMLERFHEVLDDSQRRELGALVAEGSLAPTIARGCGAQHYGPAFDY